MNDAQTFGEVKSRLDEIVDEVSKEGVSLDEALALYEEAVKLGLSACDLTETGIPEDAAEPVDQAADTASDHAANQMANQVTDQAADPVADQTTDQAYASSSTSEQGVIGEGNVDAF